ncbi:2'-5' RNA ligase family protein [Streptomyces sp. NPDC002589]|uniref:2'-5' RNA ligase family protein n=1 Tax=Streptomyces sp. NPDC002589 TaxID=3154420 RepID=UPI003320794C
MERFTPHFQGRPWAEGTEVTHAYLVPRAGIDDALLALAHACRPALLDYPIDPAYPAQAGDPGTLHVTVEMVADAPTAEISPADQRALVNALHKELADVAPFDTEVGPPLGNRAGAVMDVWPEAQAVALRERVRAAIRATRGDSALLHDGGRLHMSLGYSYDAANSDPLNSRLRAITPRRAPLSVDTLHLLNVRFAIAPDTGGWRLSWEPIAEIPLGG